MDKEAKKNNTEEESGTPGWIVTFSDLATLLLTFFVLLLSMSSMDDRSFKSLMQNFTSSAGILLFKEYGEIYQPREVLIQGLYKMLRDAVVINKVEEDEDIASDIKGRNFLTSGGVLNLENFKNGFKLVFGHQLLFESGKADMKEEMKPILSRIAKFMRSSHYMIYIDGHTDNIPTKGTVFDSNDDLSLARSFNLMNYLVSEEHIPSHSIAIAGYGDTHPMETNSTPNGRMKNRRVEIIFKNQTYF